MVVGMAAGTPGMTWGCCRGRFAHGGPVYFARFGFRSCILTYSSYAKVSGGGNLAVCGWRASTAIPPSRQIERNPFADDGSKSGIIEISAAYRPHDSPGRRKNLAHVTLRDGEDGDQLLKRFQTQMQRSGILRELRNRRFFRSRGEQKRLDKARSLRRIRRRRNR